MPVPFELTFLMPVPILNSSVPRRGQSTVPKKAEVGFHQQMILKGRFLKKWWFRWQILWPDRLFLSLPPSDKELIFKTGHIYLLITFTIHL